MEGKRRFHFKESHERSSSEHRRGSSTSCHSRNLLSRRGPFKGNRGDDPDVGGRIQTLFVASEGESLSDGRTQRLFFFQR